MKLKKRYFIVLAPMLLWGLYEGYNYYRYHDIEVIDYSTLMLRVEYGEITIGDVQRGAEHAMEYIVCRASLDEDTNQRCLQNFRDRNDECATQHIFGAHFDELDGAIAHSIIRRYKVCIEDGI